MLYRIIVQNHKFMLGFLMLCVLLGAIPLMAGTPADMSAADLEKGAKKEGRLAFYTSFSMAEAVVVVEHFQKKYPFLKVDLYRLNNEQILQRVTAEHRANKNTADVINLKGDGINFFKKNGLLSPYASPERKFFSDGFKDKEGYWTDIFTSVYSVVYNPGLIPAQGAAVTYQDLLKPRWKGKMGFNYNNHMWLEAVMQIIGNEKSFKYL